VNSEHDAVVCGCV